MSDLSSKKCVIEIFKREGHEQPWGLRLILEHGEPRELMYSLDPIEVRPYGFGASHEPSAGPPYEQYSHAELCALVRTKDRHIDRIEAEKVRLLQANLQMAVATQPPPPEHQETGWLVEDNGHTPRYRYFDETGCVGWTDDANQATRFARRIDAERFAAADEDAWHIVEHMWVKQDGDGVHCSTATKGVRPISKECPLCKAPDWNQCGCEPGTL